MPAPPKYKVGMLFSLKRTGLYPMQSVCRWKRLSSPLFCTPVFLQNLLLSVGKSSRADFDGTQIRKEEDEVLLHEWKFAHALLGSAHCFSYMQINANWSIHLIKFFLIGWEPYSRPIFNLMCVCVLYKKDLQSENITAIHIAVRKVRNQG